MLSLDSLKSEHAYFHGTSVEGEQTIAQSKGQIKTRHGFEVKRSAYVLIGVEMMKRLWNQRFKCSDRTV